MREFDIFSINQPSESNVLLNAEQLSFDVFLKDRLRQIDVMVSGITYYDTLSVENKMILDSCLTALETWRLIAVASGSVLTADIDGLIKTCYEKINAIVDIDANVSFEKYTILPSMDGGIALSQEKVNLLNMIYSGEGTSAFEITVSPVALSTGRPLGGGSSSMVIDSALEMLTPIFVFRPKNYIEIGTSMPETSKQTYTPSIETIVCSTVEIREFLKRSRLLSELDDLSLSSIDNANEATLEDIDYIILD